MTVDTPVFDMGLRNKHRIDFNAQKLFSIILFATIPCILCQIWYGLLNGFNLFVILAIIFTIISMIVSVSSIITNPLFFDVRGKYILQKTRKCQNNIKILKSKLSAIIGKHEKVIEIQRPYPIINGLRLRMIVSIIRGDIDETILSDIGEQDPNYFDDILKTAKSNGSLQETIKTSWKLSGKPDVVNIKCALIKSEKKKKNPSIRRKVTVSPQKKEGIDTKKEIDEMKATELELEHLRPTTSINIDQTDEKNKDDDDISITPKKRMRKKEKKQYSQINQNENESENELEIEDVHQISIKVTDDVHRVAI